MSCFICSEKHFVSIAQTLKLTLYGNTMEKHAIEQSLEIKCKDLLFEQIDEKVESFISDLNEDNFRAYNFRHSEQIETEPIDFSSDSVKLNQLNLIKQLCCLHCQCLENQEISPACYKLEKLINALQHLYISKLPAYNELPWEIN